MLLLVLRSLSWRGLENAGNGIVPAIPVHRLFFQDSFSAAVRSETDAFHIGIDHDGYEVAEGYSRVPAKTFARLRRVRDEDIDFERAKMALGGFEMPAPIQTRISESLLDEFLNGVRLAGAEDEVIGLILLEDAPNGLDVFGGVTPIAVSIEIPKVQGI